MSTLEAVAALAPSQSKRSKKQGLASRVLVSQCPPHWGACGVCGWVGKRVPRAYVELPPGTAFPAKSKLLGKRVTLRGDTRESEVVSVATPLGGGLFQAARSQRYKCQPSLIVRTPLGRGAIETPVPRSVVIERRRARNKLCPDAQVYSNVDKRAGVIRASERDAKRLNLHPWDVMGAELPFPHRQGSSACCLWSPVHPDKLLKLVSAWRESGEETDFFAAQAAVRQALPRDKRATMQLESAVDLSKGIRAVQDHCWSLWLTAEERAKETRKEFRARRKAENESRARLGLEPMRRGAKYGARPRVVDAEGVAINDTGPATLDELASSFVALPVDFEMEV